MQLAGTTLPGYKIYEYQLVVNPPAVLRDKIMQVKKSVGEVYKNTTALYNSPDLALVNFLQYELKEERLLTRLKIIGMAEAPVP
jgi:hypothetical protein